MLAKIAASALVARTGLQREPTLASIMTREVLCVPPDMDVDTLSALFLQRNISGAPVVAPDGRVLGVVSKTDVLRERHENGETQTEERVSLRRGGYQADFGPGYHLLHATDTRVSDIMMPVSFVLEEEAPISRAAALMALEGVHRIPIISSGGHVTGIVSALDLVRWLALQAGYVVPPPARTDADE